MIVSGISSTELIAQAERRYAEVVEGRKVWLSKAAWTTGYIEGWMDHSSPILAALVKAAQGILVASASLNPQDWSDALEILNAALEAARKEGGA